MLEPLVLLLLASTSQQWTERFSVTFWTSVTCTSFCSPGTFCPSLPVWTDHLEKTLLVQSRVLRASTLTHPARLWTQILSLSQGLWITVLVFCSLGFFFFAFSPWTFAGQNDGFAPLTLSFSKVLSATPASLTVQVSVKKTRGIKQLHKHLWGCFTTTVICKISGTEGASVFTVSNLIFCSHKWWNNLFCHSLMRLWCPVPLTHILPSEPFWGMDLKISVF